MLHHPYLVARVANEQRSQLLRRADQRRLWRDAVIRASMERARAPSRVPRHWRWRYR